MTMLTGRNGTALRIDEQGITVANTPWYTWRTAEGQPSVKVMNWDEVGWLRDCARHSSRTRWMLEIVPKQGLAVCAQATASRTPSADQETLNAIRKAARDQGIPAVLTGRPVKRFPVTGLPVAGFYPDPGGEPGLREWDGTAWSSVLHADPGGSVGDAAGELAATWSPLLRQPLQAHSERIAFLLGNVRFRSRARLILTLIVAALLLADLILAFDWLMAPVAGIPGGAVAAVSSIGLFLAVCAGWLVRGIPRARHRVRRLREIAEAASVAVLRAGAQDVESRPETTWSVSGRQDSELRLADHEITVRAGGKTRWIGWDDVRWFRDGRDLHLPPGLRKDGWALAIVLTDGSVVIPDATKSNRQAPQETILAIRHAAAHHGIPAVLTGRPVRDEPSPPDRPGLYPDPGGEPGLREWTGTEWLPSLLVDRGDNLPRGDQRGRSIWSPLSPDEQQRQWGAAIAAVESRISVIAQALTIALCAGFCGLGFAPVEVIRFAIEYGWGLGLPPAAAIVLYAFGILCTLGMVVLSLTPVRHHRAAVKVAGAARAASARAAAEAEGVPPPADVEMSDSVPAGASDTPPARRRRLLRVAGVAITLTVIAAVVAGTLIDQHARAGAVPKLSGQVHELSGHVNGLNGEIHDPDGQGVFSLAFSPDGRVMAIGDGNGTIFWWDVASRWSASSATDPESGGIYSLAFSPDGRMIAAGDGNGTAYLWNAGTGRLSAQVVVGGAVSSAAFSPDGRMLAIGDSNGTTYLWNVTARALATQLTSRACDSVSSVAFNASGSTLAVGCDHGSVLLWNMVTRDVTTVLAAHGAGGLIAVAFSPDDRKVAAVDEGCRLYLWDVATGHLKVILQGVDSIAFSPDGRTLAAGSTDGRVYRWSLSGHLIATRTDPDSAGVRSVAFSPDGSTIAVGDSIGTTYLWHAN